MRVVVTGGAGYIGSHTCIKLIEAGYELHVVDNFCNSSPEVMLRVEQITGTPLPMSVVDILDREAVVDVFERFEPEAVIHFAGLKAVGESIRFPIKYYQTNVAGTLNLLDGMHQVGTRVLVFSSSCTVYGSPETVPVKESCPLAPINPYGKSKLMVENILRDFAESHPEMRIGLLRYFNPVGAHDSGRIGENPRGIPNNLMPFVAQVAVGGLDRLQVFGGDYPTSDGTCIRDFIHVIDLASGHLDALEYLMKHTGVLTVNLGTGRGHSVLELVHAFGNACGRAIPYEIVDRRPGDAPRIYAVPSLARKRLGWKSKLSLERMCEDTWRWQLNNPGGYV